MKLGAGTWLDTGCAWLRPITWLHRGLTGGFLAAAVWIAPGLAADPNPDLASIRGVVELELDSSSPTSVRIAQDLMGLIDDGATRRVVPVLGRNARQNLADLVLLRGIDMAILQTDMLDTLREQRPGIEHTFTYIAGLYNQEFHLLAGPDVKSIHDLAGKQVDVGTRGSGSSITAQRLFNLLKIQIEPVYDQPGAAIDQLRAGKIGAVAFLTDKPATLFHDIPQDANLHFVSIPLDAALIKAYVPATLSAEDYPNLVPPGQPVDTIAVGSLLAVARLSPETERYRNVSNFVDVLFTQFGSLRETGHHPMWRDINFAAEVPGWTRFPPAQTWLDRNAAVARTNPQDMKTMFTRFLDTRQQAVAGSSISDQEKQELFNEFQRWQAGQNR